MTVSHGRTAASAAPGDGASLRQLFCRTRRPNSAVRIKDIPPRRWPTRRRAATERESLIKNPEWTRCSAWQPAEPHRVLILFFFGAAGLIIMLSEPRWRKCKNEKKMAGVLQFSAVSAKNSQRAALKSSSLIRDHVVGVWLNQSERSVETTRRSYSLDLAMTKKQGVTGSLWGKNVYVTGQHFLNEKRAKHNT